MRLALREYMCVLCKCAHLLNGPLTDTQWFFSHQKHRLEPWSQKAHTHLSVCHGTMSAFFGASLELDVNATVLFSTVAGLLLESIGKL